MVLPKLHQRGHILFGIHHPNHPSMRCLKKCSQILQGSYLEITTRRPDFYFYSHVNFRCDIVKSFSCVFGCILQAERHACFHVGLVLSQDMATETMLSLSTILCPLPVSILRCPILRWRSSSLISRDSRHDVFEDINSQVTRIDIRQCQRVQCFYLKNLQ